MVRTQTAIEKLERVFAARPNGDFHPDHSCGWSFGGALEVRYSPCDSVFTLHWGAGEGLEEAKSLSADLAKAIGFCEEARKLASEEN